MIITGIDWQHWGDVATATAPIGTMLLFAVTAGQAVILRAQVKQGQVGVAEAARAAAAAERAVTEATRARIDARASHVVAFISEPHWPPYLDRVRGADAWGRPIPLDPLNRQHMSPEMQFVFPSNSEMFLWFYSRLTLINEGLTTAQIEIGNGDVQIASALRPEESATQGNLQRIGGYPGSNRYALPPGQPMYLDWCTGRTLQEWKLALEEADPPNPLGTCVADISIVDEDREGIMDNISILLAGRPIEPVQGQEGQWHLTTDNQSIATVVRRSRRYRVDGVWSTFAPDEYDTLYNAWEALAQKGQRTRA